MPAHLEWYLQRLLRMPVREWPHRLIELIRRGTDRRWSGGWNGFGGTGKLAGLPGLARLSLTPTLSAQAQDVARDVKSGQQSFLNQNWKSEPSWWRDTKSWFADPVSGMIWPHDNFGPDTPFRNSQAEIKFILELNRLQFLPALAATGDTKTTLDLVFSWMDANPPWRGVNWGSGIEASTRLVSLFAALALMGDGPWLEDARIAAFVDAHLTWIERYPSKYSSANNHRMAELTGLVLAGSCAPFRPAAAVHAAAAWNEIQELLLTLFYDDGVGAEQSPSYAAYALEWFLLAAVAAKAQSHTVDRDVRARVAAAAEALCWLCDEQGTQPEIGDNDEACALSLGKKETHYALSVAALACRWLEIPEPSQASGSTTLRDVLLARSFGERAAPLGARNFAAGGYSIWRHQSSQGLALLVFDHGPLGALSIAAHGHADALSVWLNWGDEVIFADAGTYLYHSGGTMRDQLRGTLAHNTLTIEADNQSRIIGPFAWSQHADVRLLAATEQKAEAAHQGYVKRYGLAHRRLVRFNGDTIDIFDYLDGAPARAGLQWSIGFTLGSQVMATASGKDAYLKTTSGRRLLCTAPVPWELTEVPHSPSFNRLQTVSRLTLSGLVDARFEDGLVSHTRLTLLSREEP